jgi:uncharacterized protein (TIGR03066 family)
MKPVTLVAVGLALLFFAVPARPDEKIPDGVIGTWQSQEADKHPVGFEKDGTCHYGWKKTGDDWVMATGTFTIDAAGKVTAELKHDGVTFRPWFKFKDGVLTGPKGPKPTVTWKKVEKK